MNSRAVCASLWGPETDQGRGEEREEVTLRSFWPVERQLAVKWKEKKHGFTVKLAHLNQLTHSYSSWGGVDKPLPIMKRICAGGNNQLGGEPGKSETLPMTTEWATLKGLLPLGCSRERKTVQSTLPPPLLELSSNSNWSLCNFKALVPELASFPPSFPIPSAVWLLDC